MNEASWRAHDLLRAYAARDRAAIIEHLAHLEDDQLEFARGVSANFDDDTLSMLRDTGRPWVPASLVRKVDVVARFAPTEHEFTVTTAARRLARGEVTMRELIGGSLKVRDRIHTGGRLHPGPPPGLLQYLNGKSPPHQGRLRPSLARGWTESLVRLPRG
jgi:hypothetical protein